VNDTTRQEFEVAETERPVASPVSPPEHPAGSTPQRSSLLRALLLVVGLPTLIAIGYFGLIASNIYISETRYAIRSTERAAPTDLLSGVLATTGISTSSSEDSTIVSNYILSRDMLKVLENRIGLRAHYGSKAVDWVSRLPAGATEEDFLEYYREMVVVEIDTGSDISLLRVRAFDPETAQRIAQTVVELSERLINQWSERITEDTLRFARKELDFAEDKVRETSAAVTQFRNESGSVDPGEETSAVLGLVMTLEGSLAQAKAELIEAESYLRSDSTQIRQLKARIAALQSQIKNERARLTGKDETDLTRLISGYQPLILDQTLAEQRYASALSSMELARADAQRQQRYLIPFVTPSFPDEALEPERLWNILTVFFGSLLAFGVGGLIWSAIIEHVGL
jgi:capsular polysaccharide transport system permease protein